MNKLPLTGAYLRAFQKYADQSGGVPCWNIMPYAAEIVDIAARELGGLLDLCGIAYNVGISKIVKNQHVDLLQPNEYGVIMAFTDAHITYIVIDEKRDRQERRFTLAHEIGHYMLHIRDNGRGFVMDTDARKESEAELFAGALIYFIDQRMKLAAAA